MKIAPIEILRKYWGYEDFRGLQSSVIDTITQGNDTIALLATGAGKSICFQVPALYFEGKTIVISPLIALMTDQVQQLKRIGVHAECIHVGKSKRDVDIILDNLVYGPLKILYVSPERANTDIFLSRFQKAPISLIAIDEAHCISQWGYDFRPSYFEIKNLRDLKPEIPIIAVTATATVKVAQDIVEKLALNAPIVHKSTFLRDNLSLYIMKTENKEAELLSLLSKVKGTGIIYLRSRARVKELSDRLKKHGFNSNYYHGGLGIKTRERIQKDWLERKESLIVSTNAFGMGVDKSDVRYVIHYDVPPSIEEYYQEVGRAGRDGEKAIGVMIINHSDIIRLQRQIDTSYPSSEYIEQIYNRICAYLKVAYGSGLDESYPISLQEFSTHIEQPISSIYAVLLLLEKEGWLMLNESIKSPSQLVFTSDKRTISLSTRNKDLKGAILLHLLRRYEGLFIDYTKIDEQLIANHLAVDIQQVIRELKIMDREAIISYKPASQKPQITFLRPRPGKGMFYMDKESYQERANHAKERAHAMINYIFDRGCRFQFILQYFGEESEPCGKCDICRGYLDKSFRKEEIDHLWNYLKRKQSISMDEIMLKIPYTKRNKAKEMLFTLESENFITIDDNSIIRILK